MTVLGETGVFDVADVDAIRWYYQMHGYVVVRGLLDHALLGQMEQECVAAQEGVLSGRLSERYGSTAFLDEAAEAEFFVNYVEHVSEVSDAVRTAITSPQLTAIMAELLGPGCWLGDDNRAGVVYQDARPGKESGYTRIGWHSDWQAGPSLDVWPATAFTFHLDGTSPQNGFLRVVPGSQLWSTPAPYSNINNAPVPATARPAGGHSQVPPPFPMPLGFEKVRGEVAVYVEAGDVILHDCFLWHAAARATDDGATRRHVRGSYFGGTVPAAGAASEFIKNAAR
jgi:ectoine hydroxylase-related dioxygenase (phytanoyl-CoA dioxygenase family)